jgi:C_GCAxxG_C_C family probable redox protein
MPTPEEVAQRAENLMRQEYHCSEAVTLAVGEYLFSELDDTAHRISNSFSGGMGSTHQETCGVLSGCMVIVGLLYGRTDSSQDDSRCLEITARCRELFHAAFGATCCEDLRNNGCGPNGTPCSVLAERAVRVLLPILGSSGEKT